MTRTFAKSWKITKVTPLHKGGSVSDANNFRPISIIPTVGKVLERLVHTQCISYLESNNLLSEAQSGFRSSRSTGTCVVEFLDKIYQAIDHGGVGGVLFLDLAKAFDTVEHATLLEKLKCLGFRYGTTSWFALYLNDRLQVTNVEGHSSSSLPIKCGVPQGSILGPLLFICYVNDLHRHCLYTKPYVYADDTALLCVGDGPEEVALKLESDLKHLSNWFVTNKLSVNSTKTKVMLFTSSRSHHKHPNINVKLCGQPVEQVNVMKYLGLVLDSQLSFDAHINKLCGKINSRAKLLWRLRGFIDQSLA